MIFGDFLKAIGQIGDRRFRRVILLGLALAVALLFGIYVLFLLAIQMLTPESLEIPGIGPVTGLHQVLGWASLGFMLVLSIFLMMPVAGAFSGLFLEDVAAAVEARHYPFLPQAPGAGGSALIETLNLLGLMLAVNVIGLVFLLPLTGPLYTLVFWGLNGLLLGREYFMTVALRRMPREGARAMRRRNAGAVWLAGVLMAVPLSVPVLNLFVPVLGAATFTHLFHRLTAAGR